MNFLAHGFRHASDPWRCAGTALPDWTRVLPRRCRAHAERAAAFADDADPRRAALAAGVLRHHDDDRVFHQSPVFAETLDLAVAVLAPLRAEVPGFRARFAGHVLVEMLLDATLVMDEPSRLDRYYEALGSIDPAGFESVAAPFLESPAGVNPATGLGCLMEGFVRSRFIAEYVDDARVAARFDQVAVRVGLPPCAERVVAHVPALRAIVGPRAACLVAPALR